MSLVRQKTTTDTVRYLSSHLFNIIITELRWYQLLYGTWIITVK